MKALISSEDTPAPVGPYSPGLSVGEWIFLSGQGGFDPQTGKVISDDIAEQTAQTFRNIEYSSRRPVRRSTKWCPVWCTSPTCRSSGPSMRSTRRSSRA